MAELSLLESTLDEIAAMVETLPLVRVAIFQGAHKCLQLQSERRLGRHFWALERRFELILLKSGRRTIRGVYAVLAEGTRRVASGYRGDTDDEGGRYQYGTAPVAYLNRYRLFSITQRHEAVATSEAAAIVPGKLYEKLTPGQPVTVDPELVELLRRCRDALGWSRREFAENFQTSPHMVKHWEWSDTPPLSEIERDLRAEWMNMTRGGKRRKSPQVYRIPLGIWPHLVRVLRFQNNNRSIALADEIETKAMGGTPSHRPVYDLRRIQPAERPAAPTEHAKPLPIEFVRQRGAEAVDHIAGGTTSRYMRGYQEEEHERLAAARAAQQKKES